MNMAESLETSLFKIFETLELDKKGTRLAVGVSGGADSSALAFLAKAYGALRGIEIMTLTVDHGLRPESSAEAQRVKALMRSHGLAHTTLVWQGEKPQTSIQEKAREARYRLLRTYCQHHGLNTLLLAHHLDDQEETLVLRFLRHSRLSGLAGMPALFQWPGVRVIRPLLPFRKEQLLAYLREKSLPWIEDPSNQNRLFTRVQVRHALTQSRPWPLRHLATFERLRESFESVLNQLILRLVCLYPEGYAGIERALFERLPPSFQSDLLERVITTIGGLSAPPRRKRVDLLAQKIHASHGERFCFGGCLLYKSKKEVRVLREPCAVAPPQACAPFLETPSDIVWDGRFAFQISSVHASPAQERLSDLRVGALGHDDLLRLKREKKSSSSTKLPSLILQTVPALRLEGTLVCVPALAYVSDPKWTPLLSSLMCCPRIPLTRPFVSSHSLWKPPL